MYNKEALYLVGRCELANLTGGITKTLTIISHLQDYKEHALDNDSTVKALFSLAGKYRKCLEDTYIIMSINEALYHPQDYKKHSEDNEKTVKALLSLAGQYSKSLEAEADMTHEQRALNYVGKLDPRRHLQASLCWAFFHFLPRIMLLSVIFKPAFSLLLISFTLFTFLSASCSIFLL